MNDCAQESLRYDNAPPELNESNADYRHRAKVSG